MDNPNENEELKQIQDEESELQKQMEEMQARIREAREKKWAVVKKMEDEKKALEAIRPVKIVAVDLAGAHIIVEGDVRDDILAVWRSVPNRAYRGANQNSIPLNEWKKTCDKLLALPNVSIEYTESAKNAIEYVLNAPVWDITVDSKYLFAKPGPQAYQYILHSIMSAEWDVNKKRYRFALSEAWKVAERLSTVEGCVWSEEAQTLATTQMENRARLDKIAVMESGEIYKDYVFSNSNGVIKKLRPFQEVGCDFIELTNHRALVCYDMGLGKTWMALAPADRHKLRTLILCPASLKSKWCREVYNLTNIKPVALYGKQPDQYALELLMIRKPQYVVMNYDVISGYENDKKETVDTEGYTHVKEIKARYWWVDLLNMAGFDYVIIDEGHYIKNTDSHRSQAVRKLNCKRVVILTGTPVMNRPGELWPMLYMIDRNTFPEEEPFIRQFSTDRKTAKNVEELRNLLKPIMIRRLQRDVKKDLPPINRINEWHELSDKARMLYQRVLEGIYEQIAEYDARGVPREKQVTNILVQIQRLKQVCAIDKAAHTADIASDLYEQTDESEHRKVLIFTQYKAVAYAIYQRLADQGCLSFVSRGDSDFVTAGEGERDRLVQQFQTDDSIRYLIVTERTAKEGHNITAAGHVIFNDLFWTPAAHEQGEGRAYGRENDCHNINSYYMITEMGGESIEEWIMQLLARKLTVIREVVEGVEASRDVSVATELIEKIRDAMFVRKGK